MNDTKIKITLENEKEYYVAFSIDVESKKYAFLMNTKNNFDICIVELFNEEIRPITEKDELVFVLSKMGKFITTFYDM